MAWRGKAAQAELIFSTYHKLFSKPLCVVGANQSVLEGLYTAPLAVLSHGVEDDPVFNFANQVALDRFELKWEDMIQLPSRFSAEAPNREERKILLDRVSKDGYIDDYQGVRISSTGQRFMIKQAAVCIYIYI